MKVLVTGASGFVGRSLVPYLRDCGFEVVAVTRNGNGFGEVAITDIGYSTDWKTALMGCQAVVHTATRVHRMEESALQDLEQARRVNTHGSLHLARQAAASGVHRFIFISSVKVNGEAGSFSVDSPCHPYDAYGISKYEAEAGLAEIATKTGMQLIVLRLPLVYGPGVGANFLRLMQLVQSGLPLPLGAVTNRRSMIYLGNLIDAIRACLQLPMVGNKIWYISDGKDISTADLIRTLASNMGVKLCLLRVPLFLLKLGAVMIGKSATARRLLGSLTVNSTPMCKELGWKPPYSMSQGLRATVNWYLARAANEQKP